MTRSILRLALAAIVILAFGSFSGAQPPEGKFEKKPTTAVEMWKELKLERDLGNFEIAAKWLNAMLKVLPTEKDLQAILKKPKRDPADLVRAKDLLAIVDGEDEGAIAVARVAAVRFWSDKDKVNKQAKDDALDLLRRAQLAQQIRATDEVYIRRLIGLLKGKPEERTYAARELVRLGAMSVPQLLADYQRSTDARDRFALRQALERLGSDAVAPFLAGLDGYSTPVKLEILDLLRRKHAVDGRLFIPFLWYISADPKENATVRKNAAKLIADLQGISVTRLRSPKVALTAEADRYFTGDVRFRDPIEVWRWDGKEIVRGLPGGGAITPANARTYYGMKFARQALLLDPDHRPAQAVFLGLAIQEATAGAAPGKPLPAPLASVINKSDFPLLLDLFDRALREERTDVVLPLIKVIGARAESSARKPLSKGEPALVRALDYPDARVRLAAVEAILAIPGAPPPHTVKRVLEVLRNALTPAATYVPGGKVLVAIFEDGYRAKVVQALAKNDVQAIETNSGVKAMRLLKGDSNIRAMVTDSTLPFPGLAHFLAQVRADVGLKKLPILLAAVPVSRESVIASQNWRDLNRKRDQLLRQAKRFIEDLSSAQRDRDEAIRSVIDDKRYFPEVIRSEVSKIDADYEARMKKVKMSTREQVEQLRLLEARHEAVMKVAKDLLDRKKLPEASYDDIRDVDTKFQKVLAALRKEYSVPAQSYDRLLDLERKMEAEAEKYDREARIRENVLARFVSRYPAVKVVHTMAVVGPTRLRDALSEVRREAGEPLTPAETTQQAEDAIRILHKLATGERPGYDVAPVGDTVLNALINARLSEQGQLYAVGIARRLTGKRVQGDLARVFVEGKSLKVRLAAGDALIYQLQKNGKALAAGHQRSILALLTQPGLDKGLKEKAELLKGILAADSSSSGERLLKYDPKPVPIIPPPKE
jgi:hypothetical protein